MNRQLLIALWTILGITQASAAVEHTFHNFAVRPNGVNPFGKLARDSSGNLYRTTYQGGTANLGVVFKLSKQGYQVLHNFTGGSDGANPYAGVALDSAGNLYGTTYAGGSANVGVVFKVDTAGQESILYTFTGGPDGGNPYAGVILDSAGNLYGTTVNYGSLHGVVYKVDPAGRETVLYAFTGGADGANPYSGVTMDLAGNLYGTTLKGGYAERTCFDNPGCGVVYKLDPLGNETVLHTFQGNNTNDNSPFGGVVLDPAGNLYGTTGYDISVVSGMTFR